MSPVRRVLSTRPGTFGPARTARKPASYPEDATCVQLGGNEKSLGQDTSTAFGFECGDPIAGQALLTAPVIVLGETNGTREIPGAFARLVYTTAGVRPGKSILVGLEIPASGQALVDAYLKGDGGTAATKTLLDQEFWQREYQDGRSSEAMVRLLAELRRFRASGLAVEARAMDPPGSTGQDERDCRMAGAMLEAVDAVKPAQALVLCGDEHPRFLKGFPWDHASSYLPFAALPALIPVAGFLDFHRRDVSGGSPSSTPCGADRADGSDRASA